MGKTQLIDNLGDVYTKSLYPDGQGIYILYKLLDCVARLLFKAKSINRSPNTIVTV